MECYHPECLHLMLANIMPRITLEVLRSVRFNPCATLLAPDNFQVLKIDGSNIISH
jgi:hypothetical protein